ncbi:unnamed protein product [Diatraea saccharalis]|uniref:Uncharacterized protein n=1 Tax=Diatraea saccharalis TaxID=40085 RepID=A0A9N9R9M6_9NEOP|nr:unnamed protein product [Diatraea saccharalis]
MFRLPQAERVDPMEEKRQARENTINSVITFCVLCAAIRVVGFGINLVKVVKAIIAARSTACCCDPCGGF